MRRRSVYPFLSSGLLRPVPLLPILLPFRSLFSSPLLRYPDELNHYETLGVPPTASGAEIKKKFYLLSKSHHPDRNLNDPEAASRFVKVSEAYAVLGSPKKRERYDSERHHTSSSSGSRQGSHSSTSGPAGARPASGLSKRRTHFRGPPPSFYRSGGWGSQGEKRRTQAQASATATAASASGSGAGFGPGGTQTGREDDVPHFNRTAHLRTQEQTEERRRKRMVDDSTFLQSEGSVLFNVVLIGGIITLAVFLPSMFEKGAMREKKATKDATSR